MSFRYSLLSLLLLLPYVSWAEGPYQWKRTPEGISFAQGNQPVLFYQLKEKSMMVDGQEKWPRSNYIHPLYDLDGKIITEDFPADHKHHRGIFWAWHQLKRDGEPLADPWVCDGIRWRLRDENAISVKQHADETMLDLRLEWQVENGDSWESVVGEHTTLILHQGDRDQRRLDFTIRLRAMVDDISIGGSENPKGYGGFSARIKLDPPVTFHGRSGPLEPQTGPVEAGPWLDMVRQPVEANDSNKVPSKTHVAILCHSSAPEFPPKWILRSSRSMQNVAWPGQYAVKLPKDHPVVLQYRLLMHRQPMTPQQLDAEHSAYTKSEKR